MANLTLAPRSGLEHVAASRPEARDGHAGVSLALRRGLALATVIARRNQRDALAGRLRDAFGLEPAHTPRCATTGPLAFLWSGAGQWLAMAESEDGAGFERRLRAALGNLASISDQSDSRTIIRVAGERAHAVLEKGVPIDLHPRAFRAGDTAVTTVAHVGTQLWQLDDTPTYELIVGRSFAAGFWEWLTDAAAEFGYRVPGEIEISKR